MTESLYCGSPTAPQCQIVPLALFPEKGINTLVRRHLDLQKVFRINSVDKLCLQKVTKGTKGSEIRRKLWRKDNLGHVMRPASLVTVPVSNHRRAFVWIYFSTSAALSGTSMTFKIEMDGSELLS